MHVRTTTVLPLNLLTFLSLNLILILDILHINAFETFLNELYTQIMFQLSILSAKIIICLMKNSLIMIRFFQKPLKKSYTCTMIENTIAINIAAIHL